MPHTGLVEMENPTAMGRVVPLDIMRQNYEWLISMVCRCIWMAHGSSMPPLPWAVMSRRSPQYCDSVMFCLSKGSVRAGGFHCSGQQGVHRPCP